MNNTIIDLEVRRKSYRRPAFSIPALESFALTVSQGESVAIVGESGVSKSTLLHILGLIDRKFEGRYRLFGRDINELSEVAIAAWRNSSLGFILKESTLINSLSIKE